jgi:hypothetical protein
MLPGDDEIRRYPERMEAALKILVIGGVAAITLSLLLGVDIARRRRAGLSQPEVHAWLVAHQTILFQGFMLLGLGFAMVFADLGSALKVAAASLLVAGSAFSAVASISNAAQRVTDQFAQRSFGLQMNTVQAVLLLPGVVIVLVGVLRAL